MAEREVVEGSVVESRSGVNRVGFCSRWLLESMRWEIGGVGMAVGRKRESVGEVVHRCEEDVVAGLILRFRVECDGICYGAM